MTTRILALQTSGTTGSVAALEDDRVLVEMPLAAAQRTAQSLAPGMANLLGQVGWKPADVQVVAVTTGPGSFTGLRIGVTTAKTFAYAVKAGVVGVNTLEAIARLAPPADAPLWAVMNAQRGDLFAMRFVSEGGLRRPASDTVVIAISDWLEQLTAGEQVGGPIVGELADRLPSGVQVVPQESWHPTAAAVGALAAEACRAGDIEAPWSLVPKYYRHSAAEEKWLRRQAPSRSPLPPGEG